MIRYRQTNRGTLPAAEIVLAYQQAFNIPWWRMLLSGLATLLHIGGIFQITDEFYEVMTDELEQYFLAFLAKDKTDLELYIDVKFDCDDFHFRLMGAIHMDKKLVALPIFETSVEWTTNDKRIGHALLSYVKNGKVHMVEPQSDEVYPPKAKYQLNLVHG